MSANERPGTVYWIDHYVVCTNDGPRWEAFHEEVLGAALLSEPLEIRQRRGAFQTFARCRHGGFLAKKPLPPTRGLGKGHPRYGFYVYAGDIDEHRRRLDKVGAVHSEPVRVINEGAAGTALFWQDPDGNQFEFWAPDAMPEGAMVECTAKRVGRISHAVYDSRDLDRTAAFFQRFCAFDPLKSADIAADTLVLPLAAGGRLIFRKVESLEGRTSGCGLPDAHTALVVRDEDFLANYERMWAELPDLNHDVRNDGPISNPLSLQPSTILHISPSGRQFKRITGRGDDWFDWDTNMFHFYGGTPIDGTSLTVYDGHPAEDYIERWQQTHGKDAAR